MKKAQISLKQGRRMVLNAQLLDGPAKLPKGKEGVAQTVEELGYVQIDTISVIERAHHHTLWSRRADYDPQMLYDLQAKDRRIFEYWGHAASYLPMSDYRYYLPRMQAYHDPKGKWEKERLEKYGHWIKPVLKRVLKEGPLSSKDFEPTGKKGGPWWDWKPAKAALELLFWRGELMITERRNFHRVYDLTERVLPKGVDTCVPDDDELGQFLVRRALSAYALAQEKEIREHIRAASKKVISKSLADLVDLGEVMALRIKEDTDADYYALSEANDAEEIIGKSHLLSKLVVDMETGQRGFIITGQDEFLEPFSKANEDFDNVLASLRETFSTKAEYLGTLEKIEHLRYKWLGIGGRPEIEMRQMVKEAAFSLKGINNLIVSGKGKRIFDEIRTVMSAMSNDVRAANKKDELVLITQIGKDIVDSETGQRGFLLTGKDRFLEPYYKGQINFGKHAKELETMFVNDETNLERLTSVKSLYERWLAEAARPEINTRVKYEKNPRSMDDIVKLLGKGTGKKIIDELRKVTTKFTDTLTKEMKGEFTKSERNVALTNFVSLIACSVGILSALVLSVFIGRSIIKPIGVLMNGTKKIGEGDLAHKIRISDKNELGSLAQSFNRMTEDLQKTTTSVDNLNQEITEREQAEAELKATQEKLIETAHRAGMEEVASEILHNVGNVLNSINVSTTVIKDKVTSSELANLEKVASIINEHIDDLGTFLTEDPQGKHIPVYLTEVSKCLTDEQADIISRLRVLVDNVQHIKDIIGMQQSYAKVLGVEVQMSLSTLAEDAIQINSAGLERHGAQLIREFEDLPDVEIDKQRALQILVNLINNAKYALSDSNKEEKLLTIRIYKHGDYRFRIEVADNGAGISEDNLTRIFSHGFTTKEHGHGFGLHSCSLASQEMGGSLTVHSDGLGQGATFTLELPFKPVGVVV